MFVSQACKRNKNIGTVGNEGRGITVIIHRRPKPPFAPCNTHLTETFLSVFAAPQAFESSKGRHVNVSESILLPILLLLGQLKQEVMPPLVHHTSKCTVRRFGAYLSVDMIESTRTDGAGKCVHILAAGNLINDDSFLVWFRWGGRLVHPLDGCQYNGPLCLEDISRVSI